MENKSGIIIRTYFYGSLGPYPKVQGWLVKTNGNVYQFGVHRKPPFDEYLRKMGTLSSGQLMLLREFILREKLMDKVLEECFVCDAGWSVTVYYGGKQRLIENHEEIYEQVNRFIRTLVRK